MTETVRSSTSVRRISHSVKLVLWDIASSRALPPSYTHKHTNRGRERGGPKTVLITLKNHPSATLAVRNSTHFLNCLLQVSTVFYCCVWNRHFYFCEEQKKVAYTDGTARCISAMWAICDPSQCIPVRDTLYSEILKRVGEGETFDLPLRGKQHLLSIIACFPHITINNWKSLSCLLVYPGTSMLWLWRKPSVSK